MRISYACALMSVVLVQTLSWLGKQARMHPVRRSRLPHCNDKLACSAAAEGLLCILLALQDALSQD